MRWGKRINLPNNTVAEYRGESRPAANNWEVHLGYDEHLFHVISSDSELVIGKSFWLSNIPEIDE